MADIHGRGPCRDRSDLTQQIEHVADCEIGGTDNPLPFTRKELIDSRFVEFGTFQEESGAFAFTHESGKIWPRLKPSLQLFDSVFTFTKESLICVLDLGGSIEHQCTTLPARL